jgi:hypothetical protein
MTVDTGITILSAGLYAFGAYLGVKLTLDTEAQQRKTLYKTTFMVLGILGVVLTVYQQYASTNEMAELRKTATETNLGVSLVREQTKQPPNVNVTVPAPTVQILPASERPVVTPSAPLALPQMPTTVLRDEICTFSQAYSTTGMKLLLACRDRKCDPWKDESIVKWQETVRNFLRHEDLSSPSAIAREFEQASLASQSAAASVTPFLADAYRRVSGQITFLQRIVSEKCVPGSYQVR